MLDFVRDIYSSFRQTSLERVKSPFLGAFVFSWVGFNWQMLSILFFSKKEIEQRIELINKTYDIGNYLLGPICTTALIVITLPQINKLITKIQDKPNSETVELSLSSKIKIAELQQSIAEIEAKKKLADKKEERNIEEGIENIKSELDSTLSSLRERNIELQNSRANANELHSKIGSIESKLEVEQEAKVQFQNELVIERENNRILGNQILALTASETNYKTELASAQKKQEEIVKDNKQLLRENDIFIALMSKTKESYPELYVLLKNEESRIRKLDKNTKKLITLRGRTIKTKNPQEIEDIE